MKVLVGISFASLSTLSFAGPSLLGDQVDSLNLEPIAEVYSPSLIGGQPATPEDFPGVFYTRQGNSRCTGTVIGPRVVATAAHCVSNGGSLSLTYKDVVYSGRCTHASQYSGNSTADWALCLLNDAIPDAIAETINTDGSRLSRGNDLMLMGFGCIYAGGSGGNDGVLRVGSAPITSLPSGTNYDIVTSGSSALCYGDSGGPSFFVDSETGLRYQTAINSRGNIRTTSYLSSLHVSTAVNFYSSWANTNGVKICGLHDDATGCLQTPISLPEECSDISVDIETLSACTLGSTVPAYELCQSAIDAVQACVDVRAE